MRGIYQVRLEAHKLKEPASILSVLHRGVQNVEGGFFNETARNRGSRSASKAIHLKGRPEAKGYVL